MINPSTILSIILVSIISLQSCEKIEDTSGSLVPKTVDQDNSLPSVIGASFAGIIQPITYTALHRFCRIGFQWS